eukprot:6440987-Pyramimonas_sp.AAC.1
MKNAVLTGDLLSGSDVSPSRQNLAMIIVAPTAGFGTSSIARPSLVAKSIAAQGTLCPRRVNTS